MAIKLYIPDEVRDAIAAHIENAVERACDGFESAEADEDTLTGHLGGLLRIRQQTVNVPQAELPGDWKWSINYYKFGGRGKGAPESLFGADGIFEIEVAHGARTDRKSLLFQAKKEWASDELLLSQALKLSTWREAAFLVNFTPAGFEAYSLDDVIKSRGKHNSKLAPTPLSTVIGRDFPNCTLGDTELHYEHPSRQLSWKNHRGAIVATKFEVKHRIRLNVQPPNRRRYIDTHVDPKDIHLHRMHAEYHDLLGVSKGASKQEIQKAKRAAALVYHPDKFPGIDEILRNMANRRMQEANAAADELLREREKK
jgi:hypothetical protein